MQSYLKIVGNGQRSARDLTSEEAEAAATLIMEGGASLPQVAAFMAALRIKEESSLELTAFTTVARRYTQQLETAPPASLDICVPYDGRSKTPMLVVAGAITAAACGAAIAFHGRLGQVTPPKFGVGVGDVLAQLGISSHRSLVAAGHLLHKTGLAFCSVAQFAPRLEDFNQVRLDYGMRSFFNTVEKLLNPFAARHALVGVFHYPVMRRVAEASAQLGYERTFAVQGSEGSVEVLPHRRTPVMDVASGHADILEWAIDPNAADWWQEPPAFTYDLTAQAQATLTTEILDPAIALDGYFRHGTILTGALMLLGAGVVPTLVRGIVDAQDALSTGKAQHHFHMMKGEEHHA